MQKSKAYYSYGLMEQQSGRRRVGETLYKPLTRDVTSIIAPLVLIIWLVT